MPALEQRRIIAAPQPQGTRSISQGTYEKLDMPDYRELYPDWSEQEILDMLVFLGKQARVMGCYTGEILDKLRQIRFCKLGLVSALLSELIERQDTSLEAVVTGYPPAYPVQK